MKMMNKTQLCSPRLWVKDTSKYCERNYIINVTRGCCPRRGCAARRDLTERFVLSGRTACGMEPGGGGRQARQSGEGCREVRMSGLDCSVWVSISPAVGQGRGQEAPGRRWALWSLLGLLRSATAVLRESRQYVHDCTWLGSD